LIQTVTNSVMDVRRRANVHWVNLWAHLIIKTIILIRDKKFYDQFQHLEIDEDFKFKIILKCPEEEDEFLILNSYFSMSIR
jgi:hypothetical protein